MITFQRVRLADAALVTTLGHSIVEARLASYALPPPSTVRKDRLKSLLSRAPGLRRAVHEPEHAHWVLSDGERGGFVVLRPHPGCMHLELIVLAPALRGTGAADCVMDFVERSAREAGLAAVDLYVDRRNYRAFAFYLRRGYRATGLRRVILDVPRDGRLPRARALASLPLHVLARLFGSVNAQALFRNGSGWSLEGDGTVVASSESGADEQVADRAVADALAGTFASRVRVTSASAEGLDVPGGRVVAVLRQMKRDLT